MVSPSTHAVPRPVKRSTSSPSSMSKPLPRTPNRSQLRRSPTSAYPSSTGTAHVRKVSISPPTFISHSEFILATTPPRSNSLKRNASQTFVRVHPPPPLPRSASAPSTTSAPTRPPVPKRTPPPTPSSPMRKASSAPNMLCGYECPLPAAPSVGVRRKITTVWKRVTRAVRHEERMSVFLAGFDLCESSSEESAATRKSTGKKSRN